MSTESQSSSRWLMILSITSLVIVLLYLLSGGPIIFVMTKIGHFPSSVESVLLFLYYPHFMFASASEDYFHYLCWWENLADPTSKSGSWEDYKEAFKTYF